MQCPACGTVNNPGRVYCGGCARAIAEVCPVCSFVNEPVDRYCGGCARDLLVAPIAPVPEVRAAAIGPAAPLVAAALDLENLADLAGTSVSGGVAAETSPSGAADATQSDVDGFFQRLAREGVAAIHSPTSPGTTPVLPGRTAS